METTKTFEENEKVMCFKDCKPEICCIALWNNDICDFDIQETKDLSLSAPPTIQFALSFQSAIMIAHIRTQGLKTYGTIKGVSVPAYVICNNKIYEELSISRDLNFGGLLRFGTYEQAELFLQSNRKLCVEYLKTF